MKKSLNLIVVGRISESRGKMARLIMEEALKLGPDVINCISVEGAPFPNEFPRDAIVVYVSSKQRFPSVLAECRMHNLPIIQASSDVGLVNGDQSGVGTVIINAPNLALPVAALLKVLPGLGAMMQGLAARTTVAESHQPNKTSAPITAQTFAGYFGLSPEAVGSIRDGAVAQAFLGVPEEHVHGHAYHAIKTIACGVEVEIKTKIHGRTAYFLGLLAIAQKLDERLSSSPLAPGVYGASDFMF